MTTVAIGIDFGTTNSSIARATDTGKVELAHFPYMGEVTAAYRSLLYLAGAEAQLTFLVTRASQWQAIRSMRS
jgi:molecular chaperone DnaK (HSP70)